MTLSKNMLAQWEESMRISLTEKQKSVILQRFGSEPEPFEWSEQDISEQIRIYLQWGVFEKPTHESSASDQSSGVVL